VTAGRSPITDPVTVTLQDVRQTASVCRRALQPVADKDWDSPAGDLQWSCRTTLGHVLAALLDYAVNLTLRSTQPRPSGQADPSLPSVRAKRCVLSDLVLGGAGRPF
jgi:hypothetical protein